MGERHKDEEMTSTSLAIGSAAGASKADAKPESGDAPTSWMDCIEEHPAWETLSELKLSMRVVVEIEKFKVKDLLALKQGQVIRSCSPDTVEMVVMVGDMQLGWSEFEILGQQLAVRLTRLR